MGEVARIMWLEKSSAFTETTQITKVSSMKRLITFLSIVLIFSCAPSTSYAAPKAGDSCKKANQTTGSGNSKLICKKVSGKLVWTKSVVANPLGSMSNPVPSGGSLTVSGFSYKILGIEFGLDEEICDTNPFNQGCTYDDDFNSIVDEDANFNWAAVSVSATNKTNSIGRPGSQFLRTFSLVMPNGQLLRSEIFALGDSDFSQVEVIPGGTGEGRIFFQIPKTLKSLKSLIVIRDESSFTSVRDYYFRLEW